ncbi:MAG: Rha family transcriptional regulator [Devosia sp.]
MQNQLIMQTDQGQLVLSGTASTFTTSHAVADYFGKRHDHILRDVDRLVKALPNSFPAEGVPTFEVNAQVHPQNGQSYRFYNISRSGFMLLAMGFTGVKAARFKVALIAAFNEMQETLERAGTTLPSAVAAARDWADRYERAQLTLGDTPR